MLCPVLKQEVNKNMSKEEVETMQANSIADWSSSADYIAASPKS
jgi:hypothetical protein